MYKESLITIYFYCFHCFKYKSSGLLDYPTKSKTTDDINKNLPNTKIYNLIS